MSHEPDLCAVLFLDGPAQLQQFVYDVNIPIVAILDGFGLIWRYKLHQSKLGPEGWSATLIEGPIKLISWKVPQDEQSGDLPASPG